MIPRNNFLIFSWDSLLSSFLLWFKSYVKRTHFIIGVRPPQRYKVTKKIWSSGSEQVWPFPLLFISHIDRFFISHIDLALIVTSESRVLWVSVRLENSMFIFSSEENSSSDPGHRFRWSCQEGAILALSSNLTLKILHLVSFRGKNFFISHIDRDDHHVTRQHQAWRQSRVLCEWIENGERSHGHK